MNPVAFVSQLVTEQQYGTLALLVLAGSAVGYLLAQILNVANACYHHRAVERKRLVRNG
jgi:protease II